ncbi:4-hydroxyphenylacetate 3-hydroxylase N-terminal domain-containing protein [Agrococcus baldri]|uniref:Pyoverdin chromophore biosynthetic protein pvcC n=1 Tax=Agrococcus baldri TaxID=153730 RepID=A0AA87UVT4_9MICO|nr:4-hydroxyphenylacetate 3-hydroxylase N-terminal domain-containing protein [Agrococcus baldri]GEK78842.1 pyoverdin chromophore biosynthetic protein pvcC [Agrococcus baldri]
MTRPDTGRPQTGADYLASLDDGRVVIHDGEPAGLVAEHPAFAGTAATIAGLYDTLHDEAADAWLVPTADGTGLTHPFWALPHSRDDLRAQREGIRRWQRRTHGWVGRTPEFMACVVTSMAAHAEFFGRFADNVRGMVARDQRDVTHYAQALVNPPVDRDLPPDEVGDVFLHVVRESDEGVVIRGAKAVVTGAATAQRLLVSHFGGEVQTADFAIAASVPVGTPGIRIYTRGIPGHADAPLASRFAEHDALVVFDDVLVPWEDVVIRDPETMLAFNTGAVGWNVRLVFQATTRLEAKLERIAGLAVRATEIMGTSELRGVQAALGELIAYRDTVAALRDAMIEQAVPSGDSLGPGPQAAMAFAAYGPDAYSRMRVTLQTMLASSFAHLPVPPGSLGSEHVAPIEPLLRGSGGADARERLEVMGELWDAVGTGFGARHELYERSYFGQPERMHLGILGGAKKTGRIEEWQRRP